MKYDYPNLMPLLREHNVTFNDLWVLTGASTGELLSRLSGDTDWPLSDAIKIARFIDAPIQDLFLPFDYKR